MKKQQKGNPTEIVESLIALAGSVDRAASWLYVTPSAVSTWRKAGGMSTQSERLVRQVIVRHRARSAFLRGWLMQRTTGRSTTFSLVFETAAGDGMSDASLLSRTRLDYDKAKRDVVIDLLVRSYMTTEMIVDGDVLVFVSPDLTEIVYLDVIDVAVSFNRREYEPWWALRGLIRTGKKVR